MTKTMPKIIGLRAFREDTDKYIKAIQKGKSFTVMRKSDPVFKIVPVDMWGDEGVWETVVDFRELNNGKGIEAKDLLRRLRKLNG